MSGFIHMLGSSGYHGEGDDDFNSYQGYGATDAPAPMPPTDLYPAPAEDPAPMPPVQTSDFNIQNCFYDPGAKKIGICGLVAIVGLGLWAAKTFLKD